jgi:prophage antirepressor-like protein
MKNQLQIFEHKDFGKVRIIDIDGEPWFVAKDVSDALGYSNSRDALKKHVDIEDKQILQRSQNATFDIPTRGFAIINESGLYCLALSSKLPQAKKFRRWVTSEVIPSVRKHGAYATPDTLEKMMGNPQFAEALIDALEEEHSKNVALGNKIEELMPRAHYCDVVLLSDQAIPTSVIAKDYGMTAMYLNSLLYDLGIQYKVGGTWVLYQAYANKGYMKSRTFYKPAGDSVIHGYWTQRGRQFLYDALALVGILPLAELEELTKESLTAQRDFCEHCD